MRTPPFLRALLGTLILSAGPALAAPTPYSGMIVFGDSLSDAGQFPDAQHLPDGLRFTNRGPDGAYGQVSPTLLGQQLGIAPTALLPSTSPLSPALGRPDGDNWAVGGYRTDQILDSIIGTSSVQSPQAGIDRQRPGYLANGRRADPNALYYLTGGGNDFLQGWVTSPAGAVAAASRLAGSVQALQQGGARYIMVWLLPDLGQTPTFSGSPLQGALSQLSGVFNQALVGQLGQIDAQIIPLNVPALLQEAINDPAAFGLATDQNLVGTCYSGNGCRQNPVYGIDGPTPDPERLLFNDAVHPTTAGQRLIADYAYSILSAPWELSLLPDMALGSLAAHQDALRSQWRAPWQATGHWQAIVAASGQGLDIDGQRSAASGDGRGYQLTVGGSYRVNEDWRLGVAGGAGRQSLELGAQDSRYRLRSYLATAFAQYAHDRWWADAALTAGHLDYDDLKRTFALGIGQRTEHGDTDGRAWAAMGRLGVNLMPETSPWQLSPFLSADYARVHVAGYGERSDRSTALDVETQTRTSKRLGAGLQAGLNLTPRTRLFAEAAREHEFEDETQAVTLNLKRLPGNRFTLAGHAPDSQLTRASLGIDHEVVSGVRLGAHYDWRKQGELTQQGVNLALSLDF
ncbi:autotransporter domain-containing protein [Pseudomonas monteilii]